MHAATHSKMIHVRVHPGLFVRASQHAERQGMTISEFLRHAMREQLEAA